MRMLWSGKGEDGHRSIYLCSAVSVSLAGNGQGVGADGFQVSGVWAVAVRKTPGPGE